MTHIDGPNLDELDELQKECNIDEYGTTGENAYYIFKRFREILATQIQEAVKEEKSLRAKLVTKAHKDGIADGLQMALYGVKDGSKEEKFIRHLLYSENIGNKEQ